MTSASREVIRGCRISIFLHTCKCIYTSVLSNLHLSYMASVPRFGPSAAHGSSITGFVSAPIRSISTVTVSPG